jgi:NADPH:quinone reductase-like Zn-dependent oxidoreductase
MSWLGVSSIPFSGFCLLIVLSTGTVRKVIVLSTTREATCLESEENQVHATQERNDTMNPEQGTASQMQAIVQGQYGSADILELRTIERPEVAPNEVLIEVYSAGVDRGVWHLMTGLPYLVRLAGFGVTRPKNPVLGLDVAGRVIEVGVDVTRFVPGDEVFGIGKGSFAEYATAEETKLAKKPTNVSYEQAAVSAVSGITALEALTDVGDLQSGQRVLIVGASGGVGIFAIQIAKALGGHVTGVSGPAMLDAVRELGADEVLDYTREDFVDGEDSYDLILDVGGRNSLSRLRSVLAPSGTLVIVGGEGGNRLTGGVGRQVRALMLSPFTGQRLTTFISSESATNIERLANYMVTGAVTPMVGQRFGLAEVPAAMRDLEASESSGKSVIVVRGD